MQFGSLKRTKKDELVVSLLNHELYSEEILGYDEISIKNNWLWYKLKAGIMLYKQLIENDNYIENIIWTANTTNNKTVADLQIHYTYDIKDVSIKHYSSIKSYICLKELAAYHLLFDEKTIDEIAKTNRRKFYKQNSIVLNDKFDNLKVQDIMKKISKAILNDNKIVINAIANMIVHKNYIENSNLLVYNTSYKHCVNTTNKLLDLVKVFKFCKKSIVFKNNTTILITQQYDDNLLEYILKYKQDCKTFVLYVKL